MFQAIEALQVVRVPARQGGADDTLRRLVRFVASALEARCAYVVGLDAPDDTRARSVTLWLAREHGLRVEVARRELPEGTAASVRRMDGAQLLRSVWPDDPELAGLLGVSLALPDGRGRVIGQLGILDQGLAAALWKRERLRPLAWLAAAELARWIEGTRPSN